MTAAYYNENDKFAAAWLRELINNGLITDGEVDERSIHDVESSDLRGFTRCHFFAGIGGWDYALQLAEWPADQPVWTGSCPCQPFSAAGKGRGTDDDRHLWPEFFRLITQCRPSTIFGEQVASKAGLGWLDGVQADLEGADYACGAADLCAAGVNAPNLRQRLWWLAVSGGMQQQQAQPEIGGGQAAGSGGDGERVAYAGCGQLECGGKHSGAHRSQGDGVEEDRSGRRYINAAGPSGSDGGGLGQSCSGGRAPRGEAAATNGHGGAAEPAGGVCGVALGDANSGELAIGQEQSARQEQQAPARAGWDDFELIRCVEPTKKPGRYVEKWRRVEPGTLPLAHGIPGRVGLLRGYGNAIVPQVAAEFVAAYMETT
ncbi:MAG: DNA cytosine methyltransferase [Planctomycetota bacterium]